MYIIFSMILSSSSLLLLFIIIRKLWKERFSFQLQSIILKICLTFFILPLSLILDLLDLLLFKLFGSALINSIRIKGENPTVIFTHNEMVINPVIHTMIIIFALWLLMTGIVCAYHLVSYLKFRKMVNDSTESVHNASLDTFLTEQAKALNIKRKITLLKSNLLDSAHTMGIIKPIIILPNTSADAEQKIIILHELRHIKNHDTLTKLICLICKGLYWFNPFIYLLDHLLSRTTELACDEWVTQKLDNDSKHLYAQLIITMSRKRTLPYQYAARLTGNCKFIQERIDCIMKKPHKNTKRKLLSVIIAMTAVTLSSIPALASPPLQIFSIDTASSEAISYNSKTDSSFCIGTVNIDLEQTYEIVYDNQFTTIDGRIYDTTDALTRPRYNCDHIFVDGSHNLHERNDDGGCITKFFTAQLCTKCGHLKIGEKYKEVTYLTCPH